ncbi:MAG: type 4a pilus biogenesis protein PilO [Thermodesulfobacteriota bacterium]
MALTIDSILKLPTSKKVLILVGIIGVIVALYAYLFFVPFQNEKEVLRRELNKLMKELNEGKMIARDLEKFKKQVEKLNSQLSDALTQLPNEKEIPEMLKNISRLGRESNLEFTLFKPKPEEPQQFYAKVPIDLVVIGSYHETGTFFDKISKLPRIINVVDFNMSRAKEVKGREKDVLVKTSCLINTYRFIEPKKEEKKSEPKTEKKQKKEEELIEKKKK